MKMARLAAILVVVAAAFVLGIALGEALHDRPKSGGTQTLVRTLEPSQVASIVTETVTVTSSNP